MQFITGTDFFLLVYFKRVILNTVDHKTFLSGDMDL